MTWLQILGLILLLLPVVGMVIIGFIVEWRGSLLGLAMAGITLLGAFLLRGGL